MKGDMGRKPKGINGPVRNTVNHWHHPNWSNSN